MTSVRAPAAADGGRAYGGRALVHSLATLGTPHTEGNGVIFVNVRWANREEAGVRCLAVGATGCQTSRRR